MDLSLFPGPEEGRKVGGEFCRFRPDHDSKTWTRHCLPAAVAVFEVPFQSHDLFSTLMRMEEGMDPSLFPGCCGSVSGVISNSRRVALVTNLETSQSL